MGGTYIALMGGDRLGENIGDGRDNGGLDRGGHNWGCHGGLLFTNSSFVKKYGKYPGFKAGGNTHNFKTDKFR